MKRGVWLGGLVLSLGGSLASIQAQERTWQSAAPQPIPVTLTGNELLPCPAGPAAALGRPIAIARPVPPAVAPIDSGLTPVSYQIAATPAADERRSPPPLPNWPDESQNSIDQSGLIDQVSLFASDRSGVPVEIKPAIQRVAADADPIQVPTKTTAPVPLEIVPEQMGIAAVDGPVPDPLHNHFWVKGEYLLWAIRPFHIPALVTTGDTTNQGILGQPGTQVLFGNSDLDGGLRSGLRLNAGIWLDMWEEDGFEVGGFFLGSQTNGFATNSDQHAVIARPFFDANNNQESRELVATPAIPGQNILAQTGNISISAPSRFFGADLNYRTKICCGCDYRVDFLAGFRYLNLDEDLSITENVFFQQPLPAFQSGTAIDDFHTRNQFYGGQIGITGTKGWGAWTLEGQAKLALGANTENITINGSQQFLPSGTFQGGLLALPSNIGSHNRTVFAVVPEVDLNVGYQINEHIRAFVGYNLLYWNSVVRPGDQIDRTLDITQIPNANTGLPPANLGRPAVPFKQSDFWAQGMNIGIEFRY